VDQRCQRRRATCAQSTQLRGDAAPELGANLASALSIAVRAKEHGASQARLVAALAHLDHHQAHLRRRRGLNTG
jgi:hypothetical protein